MKTVVAIVGRPNVGKSTLFNRLTKTRAALVANIPGLTRDRHYGEGKIGPKGFLVIDTGGFEPVVKEGIVVEMAKQTQQAVAEADVVIFLVDARSGLAPQDMEIARYLRRVGRPVVLAVNKAEGMRYTSAAGEFFELGLGEPSVISSAHGDGVFSLVERALSLVDNPETEDGEDTQEEGPETGDRERPLKIAIAGRPNTGKSTLVNTLLGEERVIAFDMPGTTRDAIEIEFERNGKHYTLIDTAGLRKRGKVFATVEKFSVIKTLQAISEANVVVLMIDASEGATEQDAHIAGFILESGRALVVALNKWDRVKKEDRENVSEELMRRLHFLSFAKFHNLSAINGTGISALMRSVDAAYTAATANLSTPKLTRVLGEAVLHQAPPRRRAAIRPKLRYAHQGGQNPPVIVIHGNSLDDIGDDYRRYLENAFRKAFSLNGTPLRIEFRTSENPYETKRAAAESKMRRK